ncbi:hypothetical protein [Microvirga sp. M2]|uniref:hypothetical protein n=1 Tax=Microvirga sp. M2 TaxID=3073270 RepID=UPI0039C1EC72
MFSILRFILIVGAIFYYSPVRQRGEGPDPVQDFFSPKSVEQAAPVAPKPAADGSAGHLETVWQALPENARQAVVDKILTTSGLTPPAARPSDTLRPEDRAPSTHRPRG